MAVGVPKRESIAMSDYVKKKLRNVWASKKAQRVKALAAKP